MIDNYQPLFQLMELIGKRWVVPTLLILLVHERVPFSKIKKYLKITSRALSTNLKMLGQLGFVHKAINTKKAYYTLSEDGRAVTQKILSLGKEIRL
jgi:DNA-binding HxlR family transcriptional regulator